MCGVICLMVTRLFPPILSAIMLDEAHERTLYTDIAIGLLKKVMTPLPDVFAYMFLFCCLIRKVIVVI